MNAFTLNELLELEHAGWRSLCESTGGTFYGRLMTPEALFVLVDGSVMNREEIASSLDGAPAWENYEIADARMVPIGSDSAALVYRATSSRSDLDEPFIALMNTVYCRIEGHPRLAVYQQTMSR